MSWEGPAGCPGGSVRQGCKLAKGLLFKYISKEYLLNFLVSFTFFFLIFFVNSILLLVQKIMLKNITFTTMLAMVFLSMPQFLIYTIPFATLSGTSMVLGDLNSSNELLALRSSGVGLSRVFRPIILWALVFSLLTYFVSDFLLPWSNIIYKQRLTELMVDLPTFEIESNGINTIGDIVLSNGEVEGDRIKDIIMIGTSDGKDERTIASPEGRIGMVDVSSFLYRIELSDPEILMTDSTDGSTNLVARSRSATLYLDFSNQVPTLTSTSPANLSSKELLSSIRERRVVEEDQVGAWSDMREDYLLDISSAVRRQIGSGVPMDDEIDAALSGLDATSVRPIDFYAQYYKAELAKKSALSLACLCLSLSALPFALLKLKYGRLTGFAISLLVAVSYWYILFFSQLKIFDVSFSPYLLIYLADMSVLVLGALFMFLMRKAR